jgi:CheY-like chemotaxis protein
MRRDPASARTEPTGRPRPSLLLLSDDVFMLPRIQDVAAAAGFEVVVVDRPEDSQETEPPDASDRMLTEPLAGGDGKFIRRVAELQPALILLDLQCAALPVERWLQRLKTSAATRRIPVVAFGPHVDAERLARARTLGADLAMARSRLQLGLADILVTRARVLPTEEIGRGCQAAISDLAQQGLARMAAGEFFEAHEVLEQAWMQGDPDQAHLYRAMVQTCVTYLHLTRGNLRGAAKLLLRIHQWLDPLPDVCSGIDVARWKANLEALRQELDTAGEEYLSEIDPGLLRPIPRAGS